MVNSVCDWVMKRLICCPEKYKPPNIAALQLDDKIWNVSSAIIRALQISSLGYMYWLLWASGNSYCHREDSLLRFPSLNGIEWFQSHPWFTWSPIRGSWLRIRIAWRRKCPPVSFWTRQSFLWNWRQKGDISLRSSKWQKSSHLT